MPDDTTDPDAIYRTHPPKQAAPAVSDTDTDPDAIYRSHPVAGAAAKAAPAAEEAPTDFSKYAMPREEGITTTTPTAPAAPASVWRTAPPQNWFEQYIRDPLAPLVGGAAASAAELGVGVKELLSKVIPSAAPTPEERAATQRPPGVRGALGYYGMGTLPYVAAGELTAPAGAAAAARLAQLPGLAAKTGTFLLNPAIGGATAATIEGIRSGGDPEAIRRAAITGAAVPAGAQILSSFVKGPLLNWWGKLTGQGGEALRTIANDADQNWRSITRDPNAEQRMVSDFMDTVKEVGLKRRATYNQALSQLPSAPLDLAPTRQQAADVLKDFRIGTTPAGDLNFQGAPRFIDKGDQNLAQSALDDLHSWSDLSPAGVNALKQRLYNYRGKVSQDAAPFFDSLGALVDQNLKANVKGYADMTAAYAKDSALISGIRKAMSATVDQYGNPIAVPGTIISKLSKTISQDKDYRRVLLDALDQAASSHIRQDVAGYLSKPWLHPGWGQKAAFGGIEALGALLHHPIGTAASIIPAAVASSPRVAANIIALISSMRRMAGVVPGVQGAITGGAVLMRRPQPQPQPVQPQPQPQPPQFTKGGPVANLERRAFERGAVLRKLTAG